MPQFEPALWTGSLGALAVAVGTYIQNNEWTGWPAFWKAVVPLAVGIVTRLMVSPTSHRLERRKRNA